MKKRIAIMIPLVSLCCLFLSVQLSLAQTPPAKPGLIGQRQGQPFPFTNGVAISTPTYQSLVDAYSEADQLVRKGHGVIDSLQVLVTRLDERINSLTALQADSEQKRQLLLAEKTLLTKELTIAQLQLQQWVEDSQDLRARLPRRLRKKLGENPTPHQLATAIDESMNRLHRQVRRSTIGGLVVGATLTVVLLF